MLTINISISENGLLNSDHPNLIDTGCFNSVEWISLLYLSVCLCLCLPLFLCLSLCLPFYSHLLDVCIYLSIRSPTIIYLHPDPWAQWLLFKTKEVSHYELAHTKLSLLETSYYFSLSLLILFPLGPCFHLYSRLGCQLLL